MNLLGTNNIKIELGECKQCGKVNLLDIYNKHRLCALKALFGGNKTKALRQMMWSLFPQCEILEDSVIDGVSFALSPVETVYPTFDFVIPEYRLAIDFRPPTYLYQHTNNRYYQCKLEKTRSVDYRWINIDGDNMLDTRNKIVQYINTFGTLHQPNGSSLLAPKMQGDAGWDIICDDDITCAPHQGTDIPSNLFLEIPNHLFGIIQARSSTSKKRLLVLPGIIDSGYRGRIFVMAYNLTDDPIIIKKGDRIAQMLFFHRIPHLHMWQTASLRPSQRGENGFGSTGSSQ